MVSIPFSKCPKFKKPADLHIAFNWSEKRACLCGMSTFSATSEGTVLFKFFEGFLKGGEGDAPCQPKNGGGDDSGDEPGEAFTLPAQPAAGKIWQIAGLDEHELPEVPTAPPVQFRLVGKRSMGAKGMLQRVRDEWLQSLTPPGGTKRAKISEVVG